MKIIIHKHSNSIYPYNKDNPNYCKGMGKFSKETFYIKEINIFKFYFKYLNQELFKRKRLFYFLINRFPFKIRKILYKYI